MSGRERGRRASSGAIYCTGGLDYNGGERFSNTWPFSGMLFNVVQDPRERANLKDRENDVFNRLKGDWEAWNDTVLPERPRPALYGQPGNVLPDRYGVTNPAPVAPPGSAPTR